MNTPEQFFYEHAGYSYNPRTETEEQGRTRCAKELAKAEAWARDSGARFQWEEESDPDRSGIDHDHPLWFCTIHTPDGGMGSLGCIDLGSSDPWHDTYARVIEAGLALEAIPEGA